MRLIPLKFVPYSSLALVLMGLFFFLTPKKSIDLQIAFYRLINWKIEPISWEREMRNTRWMGAFCILCGIAGFVFTQLRPAIVP